MLQDMILDLLQSTLGHGLLELSAKHPQTNLLPGSHFTALAHLFCHPRGAKDDQMLLERSYIHTYMCVSSSVISCLCLAMDFSVGPKRAVLY